MIQFCNKLAASPVKPVDPAGILPPPQLPIGKDARVLLRIRDWPAEPATTALPPHIGEVVNQV